jgi:hypothetical protein
MILGAAVAGSISLTTFSSLQKRPRTSNGPFRSETERDEDWRCSCPRSEKDYTVDDVEERLPRVVFDPLTKFIEFGQVELLGFGLLGSWIVVVGHLEGVLI